MIVQGSPEWHAERLGKLTASKLHEAVAKTKTGWGASRTNYKAALIVERLTGHPQDFYTTPAMLWGQEHEQEAADAYEFYTGLHVQHAEFVPHPSIPMSGASPDRLVGEEGLVEIKCPGSATHIDTLLGGAIDKKYVLQMQWQMACTARKWCDFASYDPRLPEAMRLHVRRVQRDDALIAELEADARDFLREVDEAVASLTSRYLQAAA